MLLGVSYEVCMVWDGKLGIRLSTTNYFVMVGGMIVVAQMMSGLVMYWVTLLLTERTKLPTSY